jgi:hypothetical protein
MVAVTADEQIVCRCGALRPRQLKFLPHRDLGIPREGQGLAASSLCYPPLIVTVHHVSRKDVGPIDYRYGIARSGDRRHREDEAAVPYGVHRHVVARARQTNAKSFT